MRKKLMLLFIAAGMAACLVPFAGMAINTPQQGIGNETKTELPSFSNKDGSFNTEYIQQLGSYFEKSFAFRPQIITADALVQSNVFKTSNLDSVIVGTDGWLYYSSTLDDFTGRNPLSARTVNNIAYNLKITQDYVQSTGADFLFTVAPNKNTLYPEHMPYYYGEKASQGRNIDALKASLGKYNVKYCDLFELFENQSETLYLKQDSHWNNKGALMAYNKIMDSLGKKHNTYENAGVKREKTFSGDLAKMIYPAAVEPEFNYNYGAESAYSYITPTKSVEEAIIKTSCGSADQSLYMYRDSFGNALLPFFAGEYSDAEFTKAFPVSVSTDLTLQKRDAVVFEIAERNISWFASSPPVVPSPEASAKAPKASEAKVTAQLSEANMTLLELMGSAASGEVDENTEIFVTATDKNGSERTFRAFRTTDENSDRGFLVYVSADEFDQTNLNASVTLK